MPDLSDTTGTGSSAAANEIKALADPEVLTDRSGLFSKAISEQITEAEDRDDEGFFLVLKAQLFLAMLIPIKSGTLESQATLDMDGNGRKMPWWCG